MLLWWVCFLSVTAKILSRDLLRNCLSSTLYKLVASSHEDTWMLIVDVIFVDWYFYGMQGCKCHYMFRTDFSEENIGTNIVPKWAFAGGTHLCRISSIFFEVTLTNISSLRKQDNPLFQIGPSDHQIVSKLRTRPNSISCLKFSKCNVSDPLIW